MQPMAPTQTTPAEAGMLHTSMRILVIEDDREAASWLVKGLAESGHVADLAVDGEEGLGLALEGVHDAIIVDRMLPKLDGLSIIRKVREAGIKTPVLILSALGDVDDSVVVPIVKVGSVGVRSDRDPRNTRPQRRLFWVCPAVGFQLWRRGR